jgi:hypothetical protein
MFMSFHNLHVWIPKLLHDVSTVNKI